MLNGRCYCGAVTYTVDDELSDGVICHCTTCQHINTGFSNNIGSTYDKLTVTSETKPSMYIDTNTTSGKAMHRHFCPTCGSSLFVNQGNTLFIKTGTLDRAKEVKLKAQLFVEDALDGMAKDVPNLVLFKKPSEA